MRRGRVAGKRCVTVRLVTNDFNTLTRKESNLKTPQNVQQSISRISLHYQYIAKQRGEENRKNSSNGTTGPTLKIARVLLLNGTNILDFGLKIQIKLVLDCNPSECLLKQLDYSPSFSVSDSQLNCASLTIPAYRKLELVV